MAAPLKKRRLSRLGKAAIVLVLIGLATTAGLGAHHSVPVNFDQSREVTIDGVLTEIVWRNPHARFRLDVTNPDGSKVEWLVEMGASNTMKRAGFPMERFHVGDRITITGNPGRRDRSMLLRETILSDGTRLNPEMRP
jgi:uncharacterized protein DUF6152